MAQTRSAQVVAANLVSAVKSFAEFYSEEFISKMGPSDDLDGLYPLVMESLEQQLIESVLKKCNGNKVRAAKVLGLHRNTLATKLSTFQKDSKKTEKQHKIVTKHSSKKSNRLEKRASFQ